MSTGAPPLRLVTSFNRTSVEGATAHDSAKERPSQDDLPSSSDDIPDIEKGPNGAEKSGSAEKSMLVEFDGPNDPGNPKNWSTKRRWIITVAMGSLVFTVTFASSIFSVNIGVVREKFDVSIVTATLGVALFVLVCSLILPIIRSTKLIAGISGFRIRSHSIRPNV